MLPPRTNQRRRTLLLFMASCAISILSSLFFFAWFGRNAGAVFLRPGLLFSSTVGDGIGAVLLLAVLLPLRSAGPGPFWACGIGSVILLWPPLSDLVSAALEHALGGLTPAQAPWNLGDSFYSLLHSPDSMALVGGSAMLLIVVAWLWPAPPAARAGLPDRRPGSAPASVARLSIGALLFSFEGRLKRRPYILAARALGIPNTLLQLVAPAGLGLLLQIGLFWPLLALAMKRAHDRGHPTSWVVYMAGLPGTFAILLQLAVAAESFLGRHDPSFLKLVIALDLLIAVPVLWASVEFFCLRGVRGANRYGPDPLASLSPPVAVAPPPSLPQPRATTITPFASLPARITAEAAARFRARFRKQ